MTSPMPRRPLARPLSALALLIGCTPTQAPPKAEAEVEAPKVEVPEVEAPKIEAPKVEAPPATKQHQPRPGSLAVSGQHACAIEGTGQVACWGFGRDNQLGPNRIEHSARPVRIAGIEDAVMLAAGRTASCALRGDGSVSCWGSLGPISPKGQVTTTRALGEVVEIGLVGLGPGSLCGRRKDGTVACVSLTGLTGSPAPAIGTITDAVALEIAMGDVYVLRATGALESFALKFTKPKEGIAPKRVEIGDVVDIASGPAGICAAMTDGTMKCRGYGPTWKDEVPTAGPLWKTKIPGAVWATAIDYSGETGLSCVRTQDEQVSCWGDNSYGQLGTGTPAYSAVPRVMFEESMTAVSAGGDHSCGVRGDGTVTCFEQAPFDEPVEVEGVRTLAAGNFHSCAIVGAGEARCWGFSEVGALGAEGMADGLVRVAGLTDLVKIAVAEDHACAAARDHTVSCWGTDAEGQLGDGRFAEPEDDSPEAILDHVEGETTPPPKSAVPLKVEGLTGEVLGLALGATASCAATSEGLYCWGMLPNPAAVDAARVGAPRKLLAGAMKAIDGEDESLCALDGDAAVHCWGPVAESYRDGSAIHAGDPDELVKPDDFSRGGPLWKLAGIRVKATALAVGAKHACLLSETGEVWCWGANEEGQVGDGSVIDRPTPVKVGGLPAKALEISAGPRHSCARVEDGQILCWGSHTAAKEHGRSATPVAVVGLSPRVAKPATP